MRNYILRELAPDARDAVLSSCECVEIETGSILGRDGEPIQSVYFPETAVISTLATYGDGSMIEMANIGREACTGIGLVLGNARQLNTNEVQVGGEARKMPAEDFQRLMNRHDGFRDLLFSTVQAIFYQVMISGACNGAHDSRQRIARWLLTMDDRHGGDVIPLTQSFLADALGLRRATVSEAATDFREKGLIDYERGRIWIDDKEGLRSASCECYDMVRRAYAELLPGAPPSKQ